MEKFIHIRSATFPIQPGEKEEFVNEGMYGKALVRYLQDRLRERGYDTPFFCCEDWGWWLQLKGAPFTFGVCIYYGQRATTLMICFAPMASRLARNGVGASSG